MCSDVLGVPIVLLEVYVRSSPILISNTDVWKMRVAN